MNWTRAARGALTRRPWLTAAVAVVVAGAGTGIGLWAASGSTPAAAATTSRLVAASVGNIRESVSTTGTIEPADQDSVDFGAAGRVTSVRVAAGATVHQGDVLGTIDSASLSASLAQAKASLASAQAKVSNDETSGITGTQLSADQSAQSAAQGQVDSAQSALDGATLRSPIDGLVAEVNVAVGDEVTGSGSGSGSGNGNGSNGNNGSNGSNGSSSSSSADFLVIGTSSWVVNASVDDTQVGLLKTGQQAQLTTDGGTTLYGTISSVGLISTSTSGTASYPVVVKVTGSPTGLHSGATGTLTLIYHQLTNVLTVPTLAVHASGTSSVVYEMSGTKQVAHTVQTGLSSGGLTQIVSGLSEGDQVVVTVPSGTGSSTNSRNGTNRNRTGNTTFFPGGGFGGGGFGGGGFGGGGGAVPSGVVKGGN